ncbi:MAG: maleylacetate reductase [Pseudomonadota bacterium]
MLDYTFAALPWHVRFAAGAAQDIGTHLDEFEFARALVITTRGGEERVAGLLSALGPRCVQVFAGARMHVPDPVVKEACAAARACAADSVVTIGGGSTTGLGKALALRLDLPFVAVPTTYSGSEMTNLWGLTVDGKKTTGRDDRVLPKLVIYDPELTYQLPIETTGCSAINAMAQAVVNAYDDRNSPLLRELARQAIDAIASALPSVFESPTEPAARAQLLHGASLAGACIGAGVTSLHHRLCHTLGGTFQTPHAQTHTVLLPYTTAFIERSQPELTHAIAEVFGESTAGRGIHRLLSRLGLPCSLAALDIEEKDLARIVELSLATPVSNPRPVNSGNLLELLSQALAGAAPE